MRYVLICYDGKREITRKSFRIRVSYSPDGNVHVNFGRGSGS